MSKAVDRILAHLPLVLEAYAEAEESPSRAQAIVQARAPEMFEPGILDGRTFRQYVGVVVATARATQAMCSADTQELCIMHEKVRELEGDREIMLHTATQKATRIAELEAEVARLSLLHTAPQPADTHATQPALEAPKTFCGWSVQRSSDGFIRLHRRIDGKMRSVYIGKVWSDDLSRAKLAKAGHAGTEPEKAGEDQN